MKYFASWPAIVLAIAAVAPAAETVDYHKQIRPILAERCYACHGALKQEGGLRLDTGALVRQGGDSGASVLPGSASESVLVERIASTDESDRMPAEGKPLTAEQIALVKAWIDQGAASPADEQPEEDPSKHWAFQRPVRSSLPQVKHADWTTNPIDTFIAAEHDLRGLAASPTAEKQVLLRRVFLDLVGLPPTRSELRAFLADTTENAYQNVVDRLLASPQYGERWGRHWMDVWRYSDWYGRRSVNDVRNSYPHIWRWRDWIVRSLNDDKGYDRMVMEMLAADEIAPDDDQTIAATGFIVRNWYSLNYDVWMKDLVEHTGKAFLGVRLNCAHCHDHKYDPISQEEYFKFRAFFEPMEFRHDRVPGGPPLGRYLKYVPSSGVSHNPIKAGLARVFDENLEATTYMYAGGDARERFPNKPPVVPGGPAILGGDNMVIEPTELPPVAYYPALKPFVQRDEIVRRQETLATARDEWAQTQQANDPAEEAVKWTALSAARAELSAVKQRIAADNIKYQGAAGDFHLAAKAAAKAERSAGVLLAEARVGRAHHAVTAAEVEQAQAGEVLLAAEARVKAEANADIAVEVDATKKLVAVVGNENAVGANATNKESKNQDAKPSEPQVKDALALQAEARTSKWRANKKVEAAKKELTNAEEALKAAQKNLTVENEEYTPLGPIYPTKSTGRRTALARWLASKDNPLTARVAVNHIWLRHFGQPLVETVVDFGRSGKKPTHPELLDWLAVELMDSGWSMKWIHRLIVTSSTYRMQSSAGGESPNLAIDQDNRYWWRFEPQRVEAEVVRDSVLHCAGQLDLTQGGPELDNQTGDASRRRSLYFTIHPEGGGTMSFASLFDPPDPTDCYERSESIVPQQALAMTNSRLLLNQGRLAARKLYRAVANDGDESAFISAAFEQILSRAPTAEELKLCRTFLERQFELFRSAPAEALKAKSESGVARPAADPMMRARESFVRALFSHNDFVTMH